MQPDPLLSSNKLDVFDLFWKTPNLIAVFDADDRLVLANDAFREAYLPNPVEMPSWRQMMHDNYRCSRGPLIETDDIEAWLTAAEARRGTVPFRAFEAEMTDGRLFWITETVDPHGSLLLFASEISGLRASGRRLREERDVARRASWTDELTGVANRRYVLKALKEWQSQQAGENAYGDHVVALMDIDHFKNVNDKYGHDAGDAVLVGFCRTVVEGIRLQDLFGRMGGEEFLLFLPSCTIDAALDRLEELRREVRRLHFPEAPFYQCTFSAGLCQVQPDQSLDQVINLADRRLYSAKANGRDRVAA